MERVNKTIIDIISSGNLDFIANHPSLKQRVTTVDIVAKDGYNLDFIVGEPRVVQGEDTQTVFKFLHLLQLHEVEEHLEITHKGKLLEPRNAKRTVNGSIYMSNMTTFEVELYGSHDLTKEEINIRRGLSHPDFDNNTVQWIDYGNFIVESSEFDTLEEVTTLLANDYMIKAQTPYIKEDVDLTFPKTVGEVYNKIVKVMGLTTSTPTFRNSDTVLQVDHWANTSYTYRDVLNHIAELSSSVISIRDNKVEVYDPIETEFEFDLNKMKLIEFLEEYGKPNIVNITQEPQHSNTPYPPTWSNIPVDDRKELAFANNPIFDSSPEAYGEKMFNQVKDLEYKQATSETFGYGVFEVGDIIKLPDPQTGELVETIVSFEETNLGGFPHSEQKFLAPVQVQDEYVVETDERRAMQETYILVDKATGEITLANEKIDELEDSTVQLKLDMDKIQTEVSKINTNANLILNLSGTMGTYEYWSWEGTPLLRNYPTLVQRSNLSANTNFEIVELDNTLARYGLSFHSNGTAVTDYGFVIPDTVYSFRGKRVKGTQSFTIDVREYNKDKELIKTTPKTLVGNEYEAFTFQPNVETTYVRLAFKVSNVTYDNRLVLSDMMFNRGQPKEWQENAEEIKIWAQSQITQLDDEISLTLDKINSTDHKINNTTVKVTPEEGVEIWATNGKGLTIRDQNNNETITLNTDGSLNMVGDLSAGSVGGMNIQDGMLTREHRVKTKTYTNSDLNRIQQIIMDNIMPNDQDFIDYDIDGDGRIDSVDLMLIRNMIEQGNNPTTIIYKMFLGGNDGGIRTNKEVVGVGTYNVEILGSMVKSSGLQSQTLAHPKNKNVRINLYEQDTIDMSVGRRYINLSNEGLSTQDIDAFHIKALSYTLGNNIVIEPTTDALNQARANIYQMNPRAGHGGSIGLSSNRYSTIYLQNQPNVSSDLRYKNLITAISDDLLDVVHDIKPKQYYTIYDNKVHFGYIAQDVERALYSHALRVYGREKAHQVVDDFAMLSKDESYMSLLYGEIQVLKDAYYQRELDRQKEVNNNLQEQIDELKEMIKNGL